jgi:hypothetical protein
MVCKLNKACKGIYERIFAKEKNKKLALIAKLLDLPMMKSFCQN